MSCIVYDNIGIAAVAAAVPKNTVNNNDGNLYFTGNEIESLIKKTGIVERRVSDEKTCSSDLCFAAAEKLIIDNNIDRADIDILIFISQTPDYRMPATAFLIHEKLKLKKETLVFDINLACSGFIQGLIVAFGLMQNKAFNKAIILNGETRTKVYSEKDRKGTFLFGDAGTATLIERDKRFGKSYFTVNADGGSSELTMIKGGGYRYPSSKETVLEKEIDDEGNIATDENVVMDGYGIFSLFIKEIPKDIARLLDVSQYDKDSIDYFLFHQANAMMNDFVAKKFKIEKDKIPSVLSKFGNTSSASIPLIIASELKDKTHNSKTVLMNALGAGMSWSSAILELNNCRVSDIVEI